jgi:hypothetical protein
VAELDLRRRLNRTRILIVGRAATSLVLLQCASLPSGAQETTNAFPGIGGHVERIHFHTGRVTNNEPEISPILPEMPGVPSRWSLLQWSQSQVILPTSLKTDDRATTDARLGPAKYAFNASDGHSHMWIYLDPTSHRPVYELYERGGALTGAGGANLFLSSDAPQGGISLNHEVLFEVDAKISKASVDASMSAQQNGAVLAQVFAGFTVHFPEKDGGTISTMFLQLPIARSTPAQTAYQSCTTEGGHRTIIFGPLQEKNSALPFEADKGALRHLRFNINSYICEILSKPIVCGDSAGQKTSWMPSAGVTGFQDWKITSMYVGLETEAQDLRPQSLTKDVQGKVEVAMQLADLKVTPDYGHDLSPSSCPLLKAATRVPR